MESIKRQQIGVLSSKRSEANESSRSCGVLDHLGGRRQTQINVT